MAGLSFLMRSANCRHRYRSNCYVCYRSESLSGLEVHKQSKWISEFLQLQTRTLKKRFKLESFVRICFIDSTWFLLKCQNYESAGKIFHYSQIILRRSTARNVIVGSMEFRRKQKRI